jgi:hypothetical protein
MPRVFVVQNPMRRDPTSGELVHIFDLRSAHGYGELHVLLPAGPVAWATLDIVGQLYEHLESFRPEDYLLCLGDPAAIAAASAIVSDVNTGVIPLLVWDKQTRGYNEVRVDLGFPVELEGAR